ncbi:MAG TPA: helix-turn-helix transcriptional regulator [Candidatus Cloacimonadota bacterium]|nr:helix-turn-helix transcriptional regulator [Candidatus Cloacimonadota bacterium]HPS38177.1 helix-turn-helix transcriptional regulator [Candidatus Cloacimonadota bacterium]
MSSKVETSLEDLLTYKDEQEKCEHIADMISLKIALQLSEYIEEKGISKKEVAKLIGTSPAYITQIMRGDKRINMAFLAKITDALNLRIDFLFREENQTDKRLFDRVMQISAKNREASHVSNVINFRRVSA